MGQYSRGQLAVRIIFIASFLLVIISAIQMVTAEYQMNDHLKQWEYNKQQVSQNKSSEHDLHTNHIERSEHHINTDQLDPDQQHLLVSEHDQSFDDLQLDRMLPVTLINKQVADTSDAIDNTNSAPSKSEDGPVKGELIGKLIIPSLDKEWPIIHGTENKQLAQGVGHYIGSALPGEHEHAVLAGHRETVFRKLGSVDIGDQIQVETMAGLFTYEVESLDIVESDDRTVIVPYDEAVLTLITCYPFNYIGAAPQRYIVSSKLIEP